MFFWPGKHLLVSLSDGSALSGTALWSWSRKSLRLRDAEFLQSQGPTPADGVVVVPVPKIMIVQVT
jgi:hypothetical protein